MKIIPQEMSLVEMCSALGATPSWIGNVTRELKLPQSGRGKLRLYSKHEYSVFANVRLMRAADVSWNVIREVRNKELQARESVEKYFDKLSPEIAEGDIKPRGDKWVVHFRLVESYEAPFESYAPEDDPKMAVNCKKIIEAMLMKEFGLVEMDREIKQGLAALAQEITQFNNGSYYLPASK